MKTTIALVLLFNLCACDLFKSDPKPVDAGHSSGEDAGVTK